MRGSLLGVMKNDHQPSAGSDDFAIGKANALASMVVEDFVDAQYSASFFRQSG